MPKNKDSRSQGKTEKDQNQQFSNNNSGTQAGTQRQPYDNDTGDPSVEESHAADHDATVGQQGQPGLPDPEEAEWSPGSDAEVA
jgi:hypothetical protein